MAAGDADLTILAEAARRCSTRNSTPSSISPSAVGRTAVTVVMAVAMAAVAMAAVVTAAAVMAAARVEMRVMVGAFRPYQAPSVILRSPWMIPR
jgi:hypothetical protein